MLIVQVNKQTLMWACAFNVLIVAVKCPSIGRFKAMTQIMNDFPEI